MLRGDSKVSETDLWNWLAKAKDELDRDLHIRRIENLVGVGDPDVQGCYLGGYFDIELKTAARPARPSTQILNPNDEYIRPEQKVWHRLRWLAGGNNFFLLQVGSGADGAMMYLLPGTLWRTIEGRTEEELHNFSVVDPRRSLPSEIIRRATSYRSTLG